MAKSAKLVKLICSESQSTRNQVAAPSHEEIEKAAYTIWVSEGKYLGCDLKNWLEAELQLRAR